MKKYTIQFFLMSLVVMALMGISYCSKQREKQMINAAFNNNDIVSLFKLTPHDIATRLPYYKKEVENELATLVAISAHKRTFANTVKVLDNISALSNLAIAVHLYHALEMLSPDNAIREAAHDASIEISNFFVDAISTNKKIYNALVEYEQGNGQGESLSDEQRYYLNDLIDSFKREGLSLSDEMLDKVKEIKKELSVLTSDFSLNIAQDNGFIAVTYDDLAGLSEDFIATLTHIEDGHYRLGVDYPTYFQIMENCSVEKTREALYTASNNRAYPLNDELLKKIIAKRDELAKILGFTSFAQFDLDDQMVANPERAQSFIQDLIAKSSPKLATEISSLTQALPPSVTLTQDGKIKPWDFSYIENSYKKNHFNIDEQKIAEYFPMEHTIEQLLDIYHQFFSIDFVQVPITGLWHEDVKMVSVVNKEGKTIGTLLLDLYPRPNKYSHAAQTTIIPAAFKENSMLVPDVSIVIGNFTKPTAMQPSLLKRNEVQTFFHEFGHALHAILGATSIASLSGTNTKRDFVELPSQMLEEWLYDKNILRKVSKHYQTGQSLPDDLIDTIISSKNITSGYFVTRQAFLATIALSYFGSGENKNPYTIMQQLYADIMTPMFFAPENHFYASFGHLTGYGAKYYGYLWSKVFALDIFAEIKKYGLLNPEIGQKYVKEILSKGGCQDPNKLLYNFLGREPNSDAFFKDLGLV